MKDDEKLDLSALDVLASPARFEQRVSTLTARVLAARRQRASLLGQLLAWAGPCLATAAVLSALAWVPALVRPAEPPSAEAVLRDWAGRSQPPSAQELVLTFGASGNDARR
jgi:hypothetical protein